MTRRSERAPVASTGGSWTDRIRFHAARWLPLLAVALFTYALFPLPIGMSAPLQSVGQAAARTVVAPFDYLVRKTTEEIAREGESRALTAQPVYRFSPTAYDSALASARAFFAELERASAKGRRWCARWPPAASAWAPQRQATWPTSRAAVRSRSSSTHFLARGALGRHRRCRGDAQRRKPARDDASGRDRAGRPRRFHPHLRRPDGAVRGGGQRGGRSGGPAYRPPSRRRLLPAHHRAGRAAHDGAPGAAPRERRAESATACARGERSPGRADGQPRRSGRRWWRWAGLQRRGAGGYLGARRGGRVAPTTLGAQSSSRLRRAAQRDHLGPHLLGDRLPRPAMRSPVRTEYRTGSTLPRNCSRRAR